MPKITKTLIQNLRPNPEKRLLVWDTEVSGFGIAIQKTGTTTYVYQYRLNGKSNRVSIGSTGHLTPDQARKLAREIAYQVSRGEDPARDKRDQRQELKMSRLLDLYMDSAAFRQNAQSTQSIDRGRIERHLKPLLGSKLANKLTPEDARLAMEKIKNGATATRQKTRARGLARVTGGPGAARKSIVLLKTAMAWAESEGFVSTNQIRFVKVGTGQRRSWVLTEQDYIKAFDAIETLVADGVLHPAAADAVRVIALTGARRGEITGLSWKDVNLKRCVLTIPEHKTGRKTGEPRTVGLPSVAMEIIARQSSSKNPDDLVFAITPGKKISLGKPLKQIRERAKLPAEFCLHSFRHSLATNAAHGGATAHEIQSLLGHKTLAMASLYVHLGKDKKAALAQKYSAGVSAALAGIDSGEVVKIEKQ